MSARSLSGAVAVLLVLSTSHAWAQEDDDDVVGAKAGPKAVAAPIKRGGPSTPPAPYERPDDPGWLAPTSHGLSGLFRTVSTGIGTPHSFRIGFHSEIFKASDFLVRGDNNQRFIGTFSLSYTPWRLLEFYANLRSQANSNARTDARRLDDEVILALGDWSIGGKFQYPVTRFLGLGLQLGVNFLNSVGGVSLAGGSTGFQIGLISSFELDPLARVPLGLHLNIGYVLDNSNNLATFRNYDLRSLQVEKFALGIQPSRMQIRVGLDFQLRRWVKFGLAPIIEFGFDIATGDSDRDFDNPTFVKPPTAPATDRRPLTAADIEGRSSISMTVGVRANPLRGLNIDLASDIGIGSPGFGFGPPVVPWNLILGLSYAYDPLPRTKLVTKETVKVVRDRPPEGKLRGRVLNARTSEPIEGATVTFPGKDLTGLSTDPDGGFLSYGFPDGPLTIVVRHPDYQPQKATANILVNNLVKIDVKLEPMLRSGKLSGRIVDSKGQAVTATVVIAGVEQKTATADASGSFSVDLKPGAYTLKVEADGFFRRDQAVTITAGATASVEFSLSRRPKKSQVTLTKKELVLKSKVHFATNTAELRLDSRQLLDEVAEILTKNPQIGQIEIGGHTDNRGARAANMQLSQARADAVRDYLIKAGVAAERLVARGYGPMRPKVPNLTPRHRERNRRVEMKILGGDGASPKPLPRRKGKPADEE